MRRKEKKKNLHLILMTLKVRLQFDNLQTLVGQEFNKVISTDSMTSCSSSPCCKLSAELKLIIQAILTNKHVHEGFEYDKVTWYFTGDRIFCKKWRITDLQLSDALSHLKILRLSVISFVINIHHMCQKWISFHASDCLGIVCHRTYGPRLKLL